MKIFVALTLLTWVLVLLFASYWLARGVIYAGRAAVKVIWRTSK
jgi:hypothetical protein